MNDDYQRQSDNDDAKSGGKGGGGGWRRMFRASSPGSSRNANAHRRTRSMGTHAFFRSNSNGGATPSSPTSPIRYATPAKVRLGAVASASPGSGYKPPMAPEPEAPAMHLEATPLQSNMRSVSRSSPQRGKSDDAAHIELPSIRAIGEGNNKSKTINLPYRQHRRQLTDTAAPLFNNSSLVDDDATNASVHTNTALKGASPTASDAVSNNNDNSYRRGNTMERVDNLINDVIGSQESMNDNNNIDGAGPTSPMTASPNSTSSGVQASNASYTYVDTEIATGGRGSSSIPTLQRIKSSATSDSVSLTADLGSVTSNSMMDKSAHSGRRRSNFSSSKTRSRSGKSSSRKSKKPKESNEEKLDTWSGVFLPCLAQIVGVIFFLRLPTITGQAGTIYATLIILCCVFSTFITSLSLSAIASNGTIQAGGPYYIISRTLGVEIGGALGLLFYLGTTLGASMHVMGAVETMIHRKKHAYQNTNMGLLLSLIDSCPSQVWSLLLMFIIARIVSVGSKYVTSAANFFLATVGLSIFSIILGTVLFAFGVYDGSLTDEDREFNDNLYPNYRPDPKTGVTPTFWGLVAIFYPATTGIMAGTNRSSKLATPNKSLPIGTIGAIAVTTVLYICQVWLLGSVVSNEILIYNKLVLTTVAFPSRIVAKIGMVTSCIGAALQCMAGAPQLLGAIAADDAIPFLKFLTRKKRRKGDPLPANDGSLLGLAGLGESTSIDKGDGNVSLASEKSADIEYENSKRAVWFTWAIASLGTLLGNIDHITPILTMFYLMMYGGINLCCFLLAWVDSPGFRPQFRYFSRKTALIGFIWCFVLSFLISWLMALLAILLLFAIFKYIDISAQQTSRKLGHTKSKTSSGANWGDVFDSVKYKITTAILARVTGTENFHAKNWRPQLLTFVDTDEEGVPLSPEMLALAAQFRGGRGLNIVVSIKHGSYLRKGSFEISQHCSEILKKCMEKERLQGFCEVILTLSNYEEAVWSAVMHSGLGPVSPNTVLMSWMSDWRRRIKHQNTEEDLLTNETSLYTENENLHACSANEFVNTLKGLGNMQRAVCILKGKRFPQNGDIMPIGSTIDIYWVVDDGGLCLLLSYIISRNKIWRRNANLQVFAVTTTSEDNHHDVELAVVEFLQQIRINATVHIVEMENTELADDFRSHTSDVCPGGAPTLTIGEKFRALKDDTMSAASSVSGAQVFPSFMPLGDKACLGVARSDDFNSPTKEVTTPDLRKYVEFAESSIMDSSQQFLLQETAHKFNNIIRKNSASASLVVTHLPLPHKVSKSSEFMEYVDTMFSDVDNMLLIQGTGVEYLTTVA